MGIRMTNIATPMPQPRAKFTNKLGLPLSGGRVYTYEPGTDIPKKTWRDVDKSVENTNPIQLDAAGEADIYGVGFYRVVVKDFFGLTIYDVEKIGIAVELDASFVVDDSGKTQQQLNDASIYSVGSVAAMLGLPEGLKKRIVQVKATGAMYQYDAAQSAVNNGVTILNGWKLIGFHDVLLATLADIKGDGTNEYTKLKAILDVASVLKCPINMCGLEIHTSNIVATGNIKIVGKGSLNLYAGSKGTLLKSAYNIEIDGDIKIDQNAANNTNGSFTEDSDCAIFHTGQVLKLKNVMIPNATSKGIYSTASKTIKLDDVNVTGGRIGAYLSPSSGNCKVDVIGGSFSASTRWDNLQIIAGEDVTISGVTSFNSNRSGIVINNTSKKCRIKNNLAYGNKVDINNEGGWGIVCSQNTQDSVVMGNICLNNQRGGATIDTYPDSGASVDNRVVVSGNILGGKFNDAYATSGIVLNNAKHSNVTGNIIFSVNQGILAVDADLSTVHGNTVIDTVDFFFNAVTSHGIQFKGNTLDGCKNNGTNAAIRFVGSNAFTSKANTVKNLTGSGVVYYVGGSTKNWLIDNDSVERNTTSSGWLFNITGVNNIGGKIRRMNAKADGVAGWQWYIYSDNQAQFSTHDNEIESSGIGYIYQGANVTAGDDTVNGSRNVWTTAPTGFKSRIGQVAAIAGALKHWNGSAWA